MGQFRKTLATVALAGVCLTGASQASAYQYQGPKTRVPYAPACMAGGYRVPLTSGQGVAVHIQGLVPIMESGATSLLTINNGYSSSSSPAKVTSLDLSVSSGFGNKIQATVSRGIDGPYNSLAYPYDVVDPIYRLPGSIMTPMRQDGVQKPYYPVDIWFYAFKNSTWIESQSGPSALGTAYNALTLFGFTEGVDSLWVKVLNSCGSAPLQPNYAPRVEVYTLDYVPFQQALDADYAKSDHMITPTNTVDHVPFITKGPRRMAAAF